MSKSLVCLLCVTLFTVQGSFALAQAQAAGGPQTADSRAAAPQVTIAVTNEEPRLERLNETVTLDWRALTSRLPSLRPDHVLVRDLATGSLLVSQTIDSNGDGQIDELIFQTDFAPRERTKAFAVEAARERVAAPESRVFARPVPERADDFAWENDRIAFRVYGKGLEPTMISSGIDVWAKRTRNLVINRWYRDGEEAYHRDRGEGLDLYSVGTTRGCGGIGIWDGSRLHVSRNYSSARVIANGPLRTIFELTYEPWEADGRRVAEVRRVTLDAGQNLNQVESTFRVEGGSGPINYAVGIARHEGWTRTANLNREEGWFSIWEVSESNGGLGCAVVIDPAKVTGLAEEGANQLVVSTAQPGSPVRYYVGAGWDRSGDFANREAWNRYLANFARRARSPLRISFLSRAAQQRSAAASWARRVADSMIAAYPNPRNFPQARWHYENGFLLHAIFELWEREREPRYLQYVKDYVDLYVNEAGGFRERAFNRSEYQLDDILPGRLLIALYQQTRDERYRRAANQLIEQLGQQPRTQNGGYWHKQVYAHQMWLDGLYMAGPFSVEYAQAFNQPRWFDDAAHQLTLIYRLTRDPRTGLLYHGWDETRSLVWADRQRGTSPVFWGRAIGWYMMAIVDELDHLPRNHPRRNEIIRILQELSASLARYQDPQTGLWYQVLDKGDRADNWHEASATAMFAYAMAKGARLGYLAPSFRTVARRAYEGLVDRHVYLDESGRFYFTGTVHVGTLNPRTTTGDYNSYVSTARQTNDLKGVAAFLWASLEMERMARR